MFELATRVENNDPGYYDLDALLRNRPLPKHATYIGYTEKPAVRDIYTVDLPGSTYVTVALDPVIQKSFQIAFYAYKYDRDNEAQLILRNGKK